MNSNEISYLGQWADESQRGDYYYYAYHAGFYEWCLDYIVGAGALQIDKIDRSDRTTVSLAERGGAITSEQGRVLHNEFVAYLDHCKNSLYRCMCDRCGSQLIFDAEADDLNCPSCLVSITKKGE